MKNKIMIMAAVLAVLALAVTALAVTDDSDAAVYDRFTVGQYSYQVITETTTGGTVCAGSTTVTGSISIPTTATQALDGSVPSYGETPRKAGYTFSGWTPSVTPATSSAIYRAVFVAGEQPPVTAESTDYVPYISLAAAVILTLIILIFYHPVLVIVDMALYVITAAGFVGWI